MDINPIRQLLAAGRFREAKGAIEKSLVIFPDHPLLHAHLAALHMEFGDVARSERELTAAIERAARVGDAEAGALANLWLGYLNNRQKRFDTAVKYFEVAATLQPPTIDLCAVLCQNYAGLGEREKAKAWGARALEMRPSATDCPAEAKVARSRPRKFDPGAPERNVFAFSLFGKDPFYQECAITVARSARGFFPDFTCWFYCSDEISIGVRSTLARTGAKVLMVKAPPKSSRHEFSGTLWRFLPFDETGVDVVLVRDVDSPFTLRERLAIDYWLGTDAPFLTMRDHVQHTEPLMAGMWGGFTGLLPALAPVVLQHNPPGRSKYVDQKFLRQFIWPRISEATLAIDSVYAFGNTVNFPPEANRPGSLGVGTGWNPNRIVAAPHPQRGNGKGIST